MTFKGFLVLCAVTVVAIALAAFSVLHEPTTRPPDTLGEPVVPGLADHLKGLKTVIVKQADGDFTFDWDGKAWVARDRNNYPADDQKIDALVLQMARLIRIEPKTAVPDKYVRLDLNDPKAKDSHAKEVVLLDHDGKTLADVFVGKRKFSLGGKEGGVYVRLANDSQTWLALGDLTLGTKLGDWLKHDVLTLDEKDVKRITVTHPEGDKIVVSRASPTDLNFKIENLPWGKQPASTYVVNDYGRFLTVLTADDVAPADTVPFPKDKTTTADVETFSGLHIAVQLVEKDNASWIKVRADAPAVPNAPPTPDRAELAKAINARSEAWVYQVPGYQVSALRKHMAELVKKPEQKPEQKSE
jgi:hypothetical protein